MSADTLRPFSEIPRLPAWRALRALVGRGERVQMRERLDAMYAEKGPIVAQAAFPFRFVQLFGPDANQLVLMDREGIFSARRPWTQIMGRIFPNGLLLRDGDDHKHHRRIMHQAFRRSVLQGYLERMNPMIETAIADWEARAGFRTYPAVKALTLDMAAAIFLGEDLGPETRRVNEAFEAMVAASMSRLRLPIPGLEFQRGLAGRERMVRFLADRVEKKRASEGSDMFSLLCRAESEEGERLSDQEIIDHMIFLMMAAHDTTTSTLCSLLFELARHRDWQERIREEAAGRGRAQLDFDDVERPAALTFVMKETMRRYPPLPVIPRMTLAPFAWEGYEIPRDTMVVVSPIHTHHMPAWWPDPERFDPERFAPERAEDARHPFAWIPFGGGPHHCLGFKFAETQIKAIVHQLVLRYRFEVPEGYTMPVQQAPISKPLDGLPMTLARIA